MFPLPLIFMANGNGSDDVGVDLRRAVERSGLGFHGCGGDASADLVPALAGSLSRTKPVTGANFPEDYDG